MLAAAAIQHPVLRSQRESIFSALIAGTQEHSTQRVQPFLRRAHATAILSNQQNPGEAGASAKSASRFKYWVPVSSNWSGSKRLATGEALWLTHEDHVLHVSGPGPDMLLLRYPLQGDFQFQCEAQVSEKIESNGELIFGGLAYGVDCRNDEFHVTDVGEKIVGKHYCPLLPKRTSPTFTRLSITATSASAEIATNLHHIWTDNAGFQSSPWLGLKSHGAFSPLFRNLKLTGNPVIPRSVRLTEGNLLRGWHSQQSVVSAAGEDAANHWQMKDGILFTNGRESKSPSTHLEQVLAYQRPLLDSETISYEFFYEPGVHDVSPALGKVAFLLQPEGVRIYWVTEGSGDWTGLASVQCCARNHSDGAATRPLPLKVNDWNPGTPGSN